MANVDWGCLPLDRHKLALGRNVGDALATIAKRAFPHHTAKAIEARWDLERETAVNVTKSHGSARTLTKAAMAERSRGTFWEFWLRLGAEISGETYEEAEERRLTLIMEEAQRAGEKLSRLRARREAVREGSDGPRDALDWDGLERRRDRSGDAWGAPRGSGSRSFAGDR